MFGRKNESFAKAIELKQWQDPVEDVAAVFSENRCDIYFYVSESRLIGKLSFKNTWALCSVRTEISPYIDHDCKFGSFILEVFYSSWPREIEFGFYTDYTKKQLHKKSKHYLVKGHDIYHEILCQEYNELYLSENDEEYNKALSLLRSNIFS